MTHVLLAVQFGSVFYFSSSILCIKWQPRKNYDDFIAGKYMDGNQKYKMTDAKIRLCSHLNGLDNAMAKQE